MPQGARGVSTSNKRLEQAVVCQEADGATIHRQFLSRLTPRNVEVLGKRFTRGVEVADLLRPALQGNRVQEVVHVFGIASSVQASELRGCFRKHTFFRCEAQDLDVGGTGRGSSTPLMMPGDGPLRDVSVRGPVDTMVSAAIFDASLASSTLQLTVALVASTTLSTVVAWKGPRSSVQILREMNFWNF